MGFRKADNLEHKSCLIYQLPVSMLPPRNRMTPAWGSGRGERVAQVEDEGRDGKLWDGCRMGRDKCTTWMICKLITEVVTYVCIFFLKVFVLAVLFGVQTRVSGDQLAFSSQKKNNITF